MSRHERVMHELSIAARVVEIGARHAAEHGGGRVVTVTLRVGRLANVHEEALRHGFELVRVDTPLATAELRIVSVPVRVWCPACRTERELPGIQRFACPGCGTPTADIRAGRELDVQSLELADTPAP